MSTAGDLVPRDRHAVLASGKLALRRRCAVANLHWQRARADGFAANLEGAPELLSEATALVRPTGRRVFDRSTDVATIEGHNGIGNALNPDDGEVAGWMALRGQRGGDRADDGRDAREQVGRVAAKPTDEDAAIRWSGRVNSRRVDPMRSRDVSDDRTGKAHVVDVLAISRRRAASVRP